MRLSLLSPTHHQSTQITTVSIMDQGSSGGDGHGGEPAAKRPNLSSSEAVAGEDRLSKLPDDIIVLVLVRLNSIAESMRTSVLSRRWRRIWALLPVLRFRFGPADRHILEVLSVPEAPNLDDIAVITNDTDPEESVAAWLPIAARRLYGSFLYYNTAEGEEDEEEYNVEEEDVEDIATIALPCFGNATNIVLSLGYFALALPPTGAFTHLTVLVLHRVQFMETCELGDLVSSPRSPCLKRLQIQNAYGVPTLTIRSQSLLEIDLWGLNGLDELTVDTPVLNGFSVLGCFRGKPPVTNISAPKLRSLLWRDAFDPTHVHFANLGGQLQRLGTNGILAYANRQNYGGCNLRSQALLQRFQVVQDLSIILHHIQRDVGNWQYMMEDITYLPRVTFLTICLRNGEHEFGAISFHLLRLCTGIRRLSMVITEAQLTCPSGCICGQRTNWKIEELSLNCLQDVEITGLKGADHEVAFLERLFSWAGVLEKLRITFDFSVSKSKAKELCHGLSSISRPETLMEFYMYRDSDRSSVELLSLEEEGTGV